MLTPKATREHHAHLGEALVLPPFLESHRAQIERALPPLTLPVVADSRGV